MGISVSDFLFMFTEIFDEVTIFDLTTQEEVWKGEYDEMPWEYRDAEVASVDYPMTHFKGFVINIETEE